ncbi:MAG: 2-C-methyl-D-erythritol 4-phosphate cytidylyltransferase [Thermotogae bacterium]|nr:2-C-methyl-D-erythritol 4-phosphate cytidylyltransferase [Thermotogota bacterium]HOO74111.1 2-C-methyl-D-erythritol 4-phosphate cytidylyltransferase [Tepiditoga sp.]
MNTLILVAAGKGERIGKNIPKQFLKIAGRNIITITTENILKSGIIDNIVVVVSAEYLKYTENIFKSSSVFITVGGDSRQESVFSGLKYIAGKNIKTDYIFIHDAARPFISETLMKNLFEAVKINDSAIPVIPETNTVSKISGNKIEKYLNRSEIFIHQTPQVFSFQKLYNSYTENADKLSLFTDDASVYFEKFGEVYTIKGDAGNFKITFKEDFEYAEFLILNKKTLLP